MKRRSEWDKEDKKIHKVEKGNNKFTKHKKNLYNKLAEETFSENYDDFDEDFYDEHERQR